MPFHSLFATFVCSIAILTHPVSGESEAPSEMAAHLFSSLSPDEFNKALTQATLAKVPKQTLLEARFIYYVDQADYQALAKLSNELLPLQDSFNSQISQIFTLEDDWKAIVKYTLALNNLEQGDAQDFEKNIKEAFWLSPRQAGAFAPHVEQFKLELAMKTVKIDSELTQENLLEPTKIRILEPDKDINILFFWSPWSREFTETVDDFTALCSLAKEHGITVRAIIAEQSDKVNQDATGFINEAKIAPSALWLKEEPTLKLSTTLRIQSIPTVVLADKHGKILFNGHPSSLIFRSKLQKLFPKGNKPSLDTE